LSKSEELVEIYKARGEVEARIIESVLESHGIPSLLKSLAAPSVHAFAVDGLGEVRIMVRKSMATTARELIKGKDDA
jgi:hypothetical protein